MILFRFRQTAAFTLVELLIGMTLALIVMAGVISCFVFLSRNMARIQIQQRFEAQGRRALLYFSQDARMAIAITPPTTASNPTSSSVTFVIPTSGGATTNVTYNYDNVAGVLTRSPGFTGIGSSPPLLVGLTGFALDYYDVNGNSYPTLINYLAGIKQISMRFVAASPASWNSTQPSFNYQCSSARIILRNKTVLP